MAASLMHMVRICRKGWLVLLVAVPPVALAQILADPTRPPDEITRSGSGGGEVNALQSIIISPGRRAAIIRGQTVELGGKVGDVRLIEVNETGVVLQGAKGLEVLTLFPNVKIDKKTIAPSMENDAKHSVRNNRPTDKPAAQAVKKEGQ